MTPPQLNPDTDSRPDAFRWSRGDTAQALHDLGDPQQHHVQARLEQHVAVVEQVVAEASLGERGREAVGKSRRWLVLLAATLSWYWAEVRRRIEALELSSPAERTV